jgi:DNA-binding transcriptional ArsR family regulator
MARIGFDVAHAWARHLDFDEGHALEKFVLLMLVGYVDGDGQCFVAQRTIAKDCGISQRSVGRYLSWLEEQGLIRQEPQWRDESRNRNSESRGRRTTNLITLLIPGGEKSSTDELCKVEGSQPVGANPVLRGGSEAVVTHKVAEQNPLTLTPKEDARARDEARAPVLKKPTFVAQGTREWFALKLLVPDQVAKAPVWPGHDEHAGNNGWYWDYSLIMQALGAVKGWDYVKGKGLYPPTGPPASGSDDVSRETDAEGQDDDDQRQSARGL